MQTKLVSFNNDIINLRKICYETYNYGGQEIIDYDVSRTIHISCYDEKNVLVGCARMVEGPYLPFDRVYKTERVVKKSDIEVGRVCIDPRIHPVQKFKILSAMVKRAIAVCILKNCHTLYAGATSTNKILYGKLVGFKEIAGPSAYYPATEGIYLLALEFAKEYASRKRGIFNLDVGFLGHTSHQLGLRAPLAVLAAEAEPELAVVFPKTGKIKTRKASLNNPEKGAN